MKIIYNTSYTSNRQLVGDLLSTNFIKLELRLRRLNNFITILTILLDVGFIYYCKISCSLIDYYNNMALIPQIVENFLLRNFELNIVELITKLSVIQLEPPPLHHSDKLTLHFFIP